MPRAALLSIHARVEGTEPSTWEDRTLVQVWGPRHNVFVIAARDLAVFSLSLLPDDMKGRRRAEDIARRLHIFLGGARVSYEQAGRALGVHPNSLRYASPSGTVLIRWEGARLPTVWTVPPPAVDPRIARLELARRYLHVYGPATPATFGGWSGIGTQHATAAFEALSKSLTLVGTPVGEAWILTRDEPTFRAAPLPAAPARLLPSGDPYLLFWGIDRALVVPDTVHRRDLWTPRVWPGGVLVEGAVVGTWRRAGSTVTVRLWVRLSSAAREAVDMEADALPLPGIRGPITVRWED